MHRLLLAAHGFLNPSSWYNFFWVFSILRHRFLFEHTWPVVLTMPAYVALLHSVERKLLIWWFSVCKQVGVHTSRRGPSQMQGFVVDLLWLAN